MTQVSGGASVVTPLQCIAHQLSFSLSPLGTPLVTTLELPWAALIYVYTFYYGLLYGLVAQRVLGRFEQQFVHYGLLLDTF